MEIKSIYLSIFRIFIGALMVFIIFENAFHNRTYLFDFRFSWQIIGAFCLLAILFSLHKYSIYLSNTFEKSVKYFRNHQIILSVVLLIFIAIVQHFLVVFFYTPIGWDCGYIVYAITGNRLSTFSLYFSQNPNNLIMAEVYKNYLNLVGYFWNVSPWLALDHLNMLCADLAILLSFLVGKRMFGNRVGWITYGFCVLIFGFSPWMLVPYSDMLSLPIAIGEFFLAIVAWQSKDWKTFIFSALGFVVITSIGFYIKPSNVLVSVVVLIAAMTMAIASAKMRTKYLLTMAAVVAIASLCIFSVNNYISTQNDVAIDPTKTTPITHYIMVGMSTVQVSSTKAAYGVYNEEDANFTKTLSTPQAKLDGNIRIIEERLSKFGFIGYVKFLARKLAWIASDGTFFWGGEGNFLPEYKSGSSFEKGFINIWEPQYAYVAYYAQAVWLVILLFTTLTVISIGKNRDTIFLIIVIAMVLAIFCYILMFEGRSRYLISYLPFFCITAAYGFNRFDRLMDERFAH